MLGARSAKLNQMVESNRERLNLHSIGSAKDICQTGVHQKRNIRQELFFVVQVRNESKHHKSLLIANELCEMLNDDRLIDID